MTLPVIHCPHCFKKVPLAKLIRDPDWDMLDLQKMQVSLYWEGDCPCGRRIAADLVFEPSIVRTRAFKGEVVCGEETDTLEQEVE